MPNDDLKSMRERLEAKLSGAPKTDNDARHHAMLVQNLARMPVAELKALADAANAELARRSTTTSSKP